MFRAYDIRGVFGKDLTPEIFVEFGLSIGSLLDGKGPIAVGRDVRLSSDLLTKATIAGLLSTGCDVVNLDVAPTPVVYYITACSSAVKAGVAITASHNPPEFNGLKVCFKNGGSQTRIVDPGVIKELYDKKNYLRANIEHVGKESKYDGILKYSEYLKSKFSFEQPLKIVVDIGNGTTGFIVDLLHEFGHDVIGLYTEPNGLFPNHLPNPANEENLAALKLEVLKNKADVGIAFDGDGDRIGIVDNLGRTVDSGQITMVFADEILKKNKAARILVDVTASRAIEEYVTKGGGKLEMTRVGYRFMQERLRKTNSPFAAEYSGHFYFRDNFGHDDGTFSALQMIHILSTSSLKLAEIVENLPRYVSTPEIRIRCSDEDKFRIVERIKSDFKDHGFQTYVIDGVRVEFKDGWGLVRASNTEPVICVRFEAVSEKKLNEVKQLMLPVMRRYLSNLDAIS